jgi:transcription-repair coupling factor (superfamily II helicase)
MERAFPMDRLVCGDVGFGKTEVAIRAAFKAIQDGKQVAVLAPTTLLATQHGNTFSRALRATTRFASRCSAASSPRRSQEGHRRRRKTGEVDVHHRHPPPAVQDGVKFKDLGLLVVDEEQRFGVRHKERLKKLKRHVDVDHVQRHADPPHAVPEPDGMRATCR